MQRLVPLTFSTNPRRCTGMFLSMTVLPSTSNTYFGPTFNLRHFFGPIFSFSFRCSLFPSTFNAELEREVRSHDLQLLAHVQPREMRLHLLTISRFQYQIYFQIILSKKPWNQKPESVRNLTM